MARYHNIQVNGMGYREYAYDYIVNQGNDDIEDISLEMEARFKMPGSAATSLARSILWNTSGCADEIARQIAERQEAERLAAMPWQEHPATSRQIAYLGILGLDMIPEGLTKLQASKLIDALKARRDQELDQDADEFVSGLLN